MKKPLPYIQKASTRCSRLLSTVVFLLVLSGIISSAQAQVYYLINSTTGNTTNAANTLKKVDYSGSNDGVVTSSIPNPILAEVDAPNNRIFTYNGFLGNRIINVVNMGTGAVINTISLPSGIQVSGPSVTAIKYDAVNDWVYYVTNSNGGAAALNAIYRSKPDGTQNTTLASGFATLPQWLALDIPNNRAFIYEGLFSARKILTFDLGTNTVTGNAPVSNIANAIAYDPITDYIYYITSDNDPLNISANDALRKIHPGGTGGEIVIKSSVVKCPQYMTLDAGNNRAFVYEGYYGSSTTIRLDDTGIYGVDLTSGATSLVLSHANLQNTPNYLRVYALFTPARPIVATAAISTISSASATLGGNATRSDASITEHGVVYSSSNTTPVIGGTGVTKTTIGTGGTGTFSQSISGLTASTTYYVRSYATSGAGTSYGSVVSFSTQSNDATLSALSLSSGSLNPVFASATISYTASVSNSTSTIAITPTRNQANASIKVNTTVVASGAASANFNLNVGDNAQSIVVTAQDGSTKTYAVTVNRAKAAQTITFASTASKTYGDADYAPGATASSGLTVSYSSDNAAVATIVSGKVHIVAPGTANITASQAGDASNLAATSVVQALTVNKAGITVTANAAAKIYGDADPSLTYSITTGALAGSDAFTGALTRDAGTNAGTYNITQGTLALSSKYTLSFVTSVLTVNKRGISIQPAPATKSYGDVDPGYPYYYRVGSLASTDGMTGSFVRAPGETPGTYALSIGTKYPVNSTTGVDQSSNYVITYIPEYLTITKRAITLQPAPATKVYGDADPGFPYYFRVGSLAPGEGMTGTFGRQTGEDAGVYTLNLGTKRPVNATSGVFTDQYYTISFLPEYLTITKKTLNVSANAQSKTYGDADPTLTYSAGSLPFSDTFSGTLTRITGETTGTYAISQGSLALSNNYTLSFTGSNLTIGKKTINVSADAKSKVYGAADPAFTYTADALVSGDSFTGALTRIAGEAAGSYAINQGNLALNSNYTLAFTSNNLSIGQKTINVTANAQTKAYGDADPALTYTADALLGGDTFTGALTRIGGETAGNYAINQGTLAASSNYALNYTGNNLTINKIALTYVAAPATKIYLAPNPAFTGTVTGFINGDTQASATTGTLSFTSTATDSSPQGSYPINGSGLSATNYSFIQAPANGSALTVVLSTDAALSNLSVSQGTLNTTFDPATYQYSVNVDHNTTSIDLTAVVHQPNATMLVNGMVLTSGSAITLPLAAGINYFTTVVTAQDGSTTQSYLVTVNRAFSTNTLLTNITLSGVTINPVFDSNTTTYTAAVGNLTDGTDITATTADVDAKAQVGPIILSATTPYHLTLAVGANPINVDGVAQNGDIKHYNITVTRAPSSDASLSSLNTTVLTFSEPFSSTTYNYTATVANNVSQFNFAPVATNNAATITFNGNPVTYYGVTPTINYGVNTYNIVVTSEDGTATHTYTITVTRTLSSDNNLSTLSIPYVTTLNEPFDPSVLNYTADLADSTITGLPLTAYSYDPNATMTINGTAVVRFANYTMTLHGGTNTFNIVVTPQDQSAAKTYTLVLTRAGMPPPLLSPDATLAAMSVSATGYSYNFNFAYDVLKTLNVANKITGVRIHPVIAANGAVASVNGVALAYDASTNLLPLNVGDNTFDVVVIAADGVHQTTTTLHVNRLPFADITLASLAIDAGTLSPAFSGTTLTYTASVPYSVNNLNVTPVANATDATVTIGAATINAGTPSASVPLSYGIPNRIRVTVTAADGVNTQNYTVNVTRLAPDATLAALTLSKGTLSPVFAGASTTYTASVGNNVGSVLITPTAKDPGAAITINGALIGASAIMPLSAGDNSFAIVVTAGDAGGGVVSQTYNLTITRAATSSDATLASLGLSNGSLSPAFSTGNLSYTASVGASVDYLTITPPTTDPNATVTVKGAALDVAGTSTVALSPGANIIPIVVTAQNGSTVSTYTLTVNRAAAASSTNVSLSALTLSPASALTVTTGSSTVNYQTSVSAGTASIAITAITSDPAATIRVEGNPVASGNASAPVPLNATGPTTIHVSITAQDGITIRTYSIVVNKNGSSNNALTSLNLNPVSLLTVTTGASTINYQTSVPAATPSVTVIATTADPSAIVRVEGNIVVSGNASAPVTLNATGSTTVHVSITAEDGVSIRTYSIVVYKNGSSNTSVTSLAINPASPLLVTTGASNINYQTSVSASTASVSIIAATLDPSAVIKVEGNVVASGAESAPVTLNATGPTTVHMTITAEDGVSIRTYAIVVNKNGSSTTALTSLNLSPVSTLTVTTGSSTVNYQTSASAATPSISITATTLDPNSVIRVEGNIVASGSASAPVALNATGPTTVHMSVTAEDGNTIRTYSIVVNKNGSSNSALTSLNLSPASTLTVTTGSSTVNYQTSVLAGTSSVTVTASAADPNAVIRVEGNTVSSGSASDPITLNSTGSTIIHVSITAEDGVSIRTYSIVVYKNGSSNTSITALALSPASTLMITTGTSNINYQTSVSSATSSVTVTTTAVDPNAVIRVEGNTVISGSASDPIALNATGSTTIHVSITGQDGTSTRTYSIVVNKNGSSNISITSLALSPASPLSVTTGTGNINYQTSVAAATASVSVVATTLDPNAVITVEGNIVASGSVSPPVILNETGPTTIHMVITAQDGVSTRTYSIVVNKNGSSTTALTSLNLSPASTLTVITGSSTVNYQTSVLAATSSVTVIATTLDPNSVIRVAGNIVASGSASASIVLNETGPTTINMSVTAEDGTTMRTYSIIVNKNGSSNTSITSLALSPASPLSITTGTSTVNYQTSVPASTSSVAIIVSSVDPNAVIRVEGNTVASGITSAPIALEASGLTTIHVLITGQDGISTRTYSIVVNKNDPAGMNLNSLFLSPQIGIEKHTDDIVNNNIVVHQALSPNGDGVNDQLTIDGIEKYSDNHLSIMNAGGALVYDVQGYGSNGNVFDGHSNKNGTMQKPGTYYYTLAYKDGNETKRKTGYIILKY